MADQRELFNLTRLKSQTLLRQRAGIEVPIVDLDIREFPQPGIDHTTRPLANQIKISGTDGKGDKVSDRLTRSGRARREIARSSLSIGRTAPSQGTRHTIGFARSADQRPEFHEGLIKMRTTPSVVSLIRARPAN